MTAWIIFLIIFLIAYKLYKSGYFESYYSRRGKIHFKIFNENWNLQDVRKRKKCLFIFEYGSGVLAKIKNRPNAIGIHTKSRGKSVIKKIDDAFNRIDTALDTGKYDCIVFHKNIGKFSTGFASRDPSGYRYLLKRIRKLANQVDPESSDVWEPWLTKLLE